MIRNNPSELKISFRVKISLILFGLFMFLILLEAGLRLGGFMARSVQEYRNKQSLKHKGAYRIMCVGESTTANQYPSFLKEILNQRYTGIQFSVIDQGVNGTNSTVILFRLESNLDQYHPDMVVAMMGSNDRSMLYYKDIPEAQTRLFYYCKTYRLIRLLWLHILAKVGGEDSLKKAVTLNPQSDYTYVELGRCYRDQGKLSQAEDAFKKAITLNPQSDRAYFELGQLYRNQGKLSQAEDALKKSLTLNPQNTDAYAGLGWFYRMQDKISQAEDAFKKAVALNPENSHAYAELGWFYQDQGKKPSQAEDAFKKAIELNPQNDHAYTGLGRLYRDQGKLSQAEDALKKALALNPKNSRAYAELGGLYRNQGKLSQVEDLFTQTITLNPRNDRVCGVLSVLYEEMGKPELAKEYTQKVNKLRSLYCDPLTVKNYRTLKEILDRKGIRLVCVQYPMRSIEPLRRIFEGDGKGVIFVDNEKVFRDAVKKDGYTTYFVDMFGGDFGHCTDKGNRLLAENIANIIAKEAFNK
jgi:tetratricopeptide (TPR) repeat protein